MLGAPNLAAICKCKTACIKDNLETTVLLNYFKMHKFYVLSKKFIYAGKKSGGGGGVGGQSPLGNKDFTYTSSTSLLEARLPSE